MTKQVESISKSRTISKNTRRRKIFYDQKSSKSYENINSNEKFDDEKSKNFYSYNLHSKSSDICKKCDKSKKNFISNNFFHNHIHGCTNKPLMKMIQNFFFNFSIIKSSFFFAVDNEFGFRIYQFAIV